LHKAVCGEAVKANEDEKNKSSDSDIQNTVDTESISTVIIGERVKKRLRSSAEVQTYVRSKRLQAKIKQIDSSSDRSAALKSARMQPDFDAFVRTMLDTIGYTQ